MNDALIISLAVILALIILVLFILMFNYYFLLKRISYHYPNYYKKLGSPFLPKANRSMAKNIKRDTFNYRFLINLLKGVPTNLPNDLKLRKAAAYVRFEMLAIITLLVAGVYVSVVL